MASGLCHEFLADRRSGQLQRVLQYAGRVGGDGSNQDLGGEVEGPVGWGLIALSAGALAVLGVWGWLGGKLTYRYGVRVVDEATQAEGYRREG